MMTTRSRTHSTAKRAMNLTDASGPALRDDLGAKLEATIAARRCAGTTREDGVRAPLADAAARGRAGAGGPARRLGDPALAPAGIG